MDRTDRTLWMVGGGAVGCGLLLALAVVRNERGFTERFYAQRPPTESLEPARSHASPPPAPEPGLCPRTAGRPEAEAAARDCPPK